MITSLKTDSKLMLVSEMRGESIFQILQYDSLRGGNDIDTAIKINQMKEANIILSQVRISLHNSSVKIKKGSLSYLRGNIEMHNKIYNPIGFGKKIFSAKVNIEATFKPRYEGTGEIFLKPTFNNYVLIELEDDEIIVDDELFYACEDSVGLEVAIKKSLATMILGNDGIFQTKLNGSGIVVLELPVPETEIFKCRINNDLLKVDGNFAILRTGDIELTVEKSSKSQVLTATNKEGLLNVFRGTGEVWLIPTKIIYDKFSKQNGLRGMFNQKETSNTKFDSDI